MFEPSTRTADKHFQAARWLDIFPLVKDIGNSSIEKRETKRDMVMNIAAQDFDALVIRDKELDTARMAADLDVTALINAGNGWDDHPTQSQADIYTAYREVGDVQGLTVAITGDNYHGRVNRADIKMFSKFGNRIILASPPGLEIQDDIRTQLDGQGTDYHEVGSLADAMDFKPDFVVLSRHQEERYQGTNPRTGEPWDQQAITEHHYEHLSLTPQILSAAGETKFSHPLPRGPELADDQDSRVVIWSNVKNAVWMSVTDYEYVFAAGPFAEG